MEQFPKPERTSSAKRVFHEDAPTDHGQKEKANEPVDCDFEQKSLQHAQANLLITGLYTDLRITCQGRTWNVHRCIVALRCPVIQKRTKRVRPDEGPLSGWMPPILVINMDDDDPDVVDSMLYYLYTQQLDYDRRFVYESLEKDVEHFLRAISPGDKYSLPLFGRMARTELEGRIKASEGKTLPQIVRAMHLETASYSIVALRDFVICEAAALFRNGGPFSDVMEAMAIEFPKFGFDVMSHGTKELIRKIEKIEEGDLDRVVDGAEGEDDEPLRQSRQTRYTTRTKAAPKRGRGAARLRY